MCHVVDERNPTATFREQSHDEIRYKGRRGEMPHVELKAEVRLHHSNNHRVKVLQLIALRRGEKAMDHSKRVTRQEAHDKAKLLSAEPSGDANLVYSCQYLSHHLQHVKPGAIA